jgi:hypothetical protein
LTSFLLIEIAIGKSLDACEERVAQIAGYAFANPHRQIVVADCDQGADNGDTDHQQCRLRHNLLVVGRNPLIDDTLDQTRNGKIEEDQCGQKNQRHDRTFPVRADEMEEFENMVHGHIFSSYVHSSGNTLCPLYGLMIVILSAHWMMFYSNKRSGTKACMSTHYAMK